MSNRNFGQAIPSILNNTSILGNGAFFFNTLDHDEMVSHNLLLASFAKFGIPGVFLILYLFYKSSLMMLRVIKNNYINYSYKSEAIILLSLLLSLFLQEMKISAIRFLSPMLIYTMLFMHIYFLSIRARINKNE